MIILQEFLVGSIALTNIFQGAQLMPPLSEIINVWDGSFQRFDRVRRSFGLRVSTVLLERCNGLQKFPMD
jgi:hypothetical protein